MPTITIELSEEKLNKCKARVNITEFESTKDYISFILEQVVCNGKKEHSMEEKGLNYSSAKQLESLGYL